jgi:probable addiction module antidote protein
MTLKTTPWDTADYLNSVEDIVDYLDAAFEDGDPALIAAALGNVARSKGMAEIAKAAGVSREGLYRSLSPEGNPELGTVAKVMKALGLQLTVKPLSAA